MKRRGIRSCVVALCMALILTGCGKKNISEEIKDIEDIENISEESSGEQTGTSEAEKDETEKDETEKLSYTVRLDNGKTVYDVDAEIIRPDSEIMNMYEEQLVDLTEERVISYAKSLFDGGSYEQIRPYAAYEKEELEQELYKFEAEMEKKSYTYIEEEWSDQSKRDEIKFYVDNYIEPTQAYEEGKFYENQYYEAAKKNENLQMYMLYNSRIMILRGSIGGRLYDLVAYEADPKYGTCTESYVALYREGEAWSQVNTCAMTGHFALDRTDGQENMCELSEEVARSCAENYMDMLGIGDTEVIKRDYLFWQRTPYEEKKNEGYASVYELDGYVFTMARTYDGISGMYIPIGWEWLSADGNYYAKQDCYVVYVDSRGVVQVQAGPIYEIQDVVSGQVEPVTFDQVDETAKAHFGEQISKTINMTDVEANYRALIDVSRVRLCYVNLQYDGKFRLVPVWVYSSEIMNQEFPEAIVNAIDGTCVKDNDNEYKCIP